MPLIPDMSKKFPTIPENPEKSKNPSTCTQVVLQVVKQVERSIPLFKPLVCHGLIPDMSKKFPTIPKNPEMSKKYRHVQAPKHLGHKWFCKR